MTKKKDIKYGSKSVIAEGELSLSNAKVRVNAWIDGDVIEKLRSDAKKKGIGYQTLLNQVLRKAVLGEVDPIEELTKRIEELERKVG
jgi:uncharacterized protein (DUF4415 family)